MSNAIWAPDLLPGMSKLSNGFETYAEFRNKLRTPYIRVQSGILFSLATIIAFVIFFENKTFNIIESVLLVAYLALTQHRLLNVIHEGAHWLISKNRRFNDFFCNLVAGVFFLVDVDQYRQTHIQHHRKLGTDIDPENSHMEKLDATWLIASFTGIGSIRKIIQRKQSRNKFKMESKVRHFAVPFVGIFLHVVLTIYFVRNASTSAIFIWFLATYFISPGLGLLRNLLEHRYVENVDAEVWKTLLDASYKLNETQVTTRRFTKSKLSRLYGSMGFTRHLIHHWDPSISFIHLQKVDKFLLQTQIGPALEKTNSTFTSTFLHLWRK